MLNASTFIPQLHTITFISESYCKTFTIPIKINKGHKNTEILNYKYHTLTHQVHGPRKF